MELQTRNNVYTAVGMINGKLQRKSTGIRVGGREAKEQARARMLEIERELRALVKAKPPGEEPVPVEEPASPTFVEWWCTYKNGAGRLKARSTQEREDGLIVPALTLWGERRLDTLKASDVETYLARRLEARHRVPECRRGSGKPVSKSTVKRELGLLTMVWNKARKDHPKLQLEPLFSGKLLKHATPARNRVISHDEQRDLLHRLRQKYHTLVLLLLATGLRLAEALSLKPSHIDWSNRMILVAHGKGGKSRRVPMQAGAEVILRIALAEAGLDGAPTPQKANAYIWQHLRGSGKRFARVGMVLTAAFREACCARSGRGSRPARPALMPSISPHACRHTFGHRYLTGNGDPAKRGDIYTLSKILGHSSVTITQKHYSYLYDEDVRDAMLTVDVGCSPDEIAKWIDPRRTPPAEEPPITL